jgi:GTP-binding protein
MDLPGLIQGTYKGKGVGKKFLKHTENSKVVAHFVSLDREKPFERYISMREEIAKLDSKLAERPEIVLLSKRDEIIEKEMVNLEETFRKRTEAVRVISYTIIDDADIKKIEKTFQEFFKQITD